MKIVKMANGKKKVKMSKKEWTSIGKKAGWVKKAQQAWDNEIYEIESLVDEMNEYVRSNMALVQQGNYDRAIRVSEGIPQVAASLVENLTALSQQAGVNLNHIIANTSLGWLSQESTLQGIRSAMSHAATEEDKAMINQVLRGAQSMAKLTDQVKQALSPQPAQAQQAQAQPVTP